MNNLEKLLRELNVCKAELKKYELLYQADGKTTKEEFAELKKHLDRVDMLILKIEEKDPGVEKENQQSLQTRFEELLAKANAALTEKGLATVFIDSDETHTV